MHLNTVEEEALFIIWSNEHMDLDDWHEAFEEECLNLSDDEKYQRMYDLNNNYLDDERINLDVCVGTPIIVITDIGKWNGRRTGYREIDSGCLKDCLYTELDGVTWYVDKHGDFRMDGYHHDGRNYYLYRRYREGVSEEAVEEFKEKILDDTLTAEDIDRATVRLGDDIAKIYGFTLPEQKKHHERSDAR